MGTGSGETPLFWMNNELSSHVSESQNTNYTIPAMIHNTTPGEPLDCKYIKDEVDICQELGQDYYCIATLEDKFYTSSWDGILLANSHISDCDSDFDDYPIKVCCTIPAG